MLRLCSFFLLASGLHAAADLEQYAIPAFTLKEITSAHSEKALVSSLETSGVIAIKDIPDFEQIRYDYLLAAAKCMSSPGHFDQLLHKTLSDGTKRISLSTGMTGVVKEVADRCPDYAEKYRIYASILDKVSVLLATILDSTAANGSQPLLPIAVKGSHLDHSHFYSNPLGASYHNKSLDDISALSLELHSDHGLMLFTSAPIFFDKVNGDIVQVPNPNPEAGLFFSIGGSLVHPVLKPDELVVMIGDGFSSWGNFGHKFPAVLHGMRMPPDAKESTLRAFTGRMILLESDYIMASTGISFSKFNSINRRQLKATGEVVSLGCPIGRRLKAMDDACLLGLYEPRRGSKLTREQCMRLCNNEHTDEEDCAKVCKKVGEKRDGGIDCWMVCVERLSKSKCPAPHQQVCTDDQKLICKK